MPASSRPRRVPTRRQKIIESSSSEEEEEEEEEEEVAQPKDEDDEEDDDEEEEDEEEDEDEAEYTPVAATPRRASRRVTSQPPASAAPASRTSRGARERIPPSRVTARGRGGRATRRQRISDSAEEAAEEPAPAPARAAARRQRVPDSSEEEAEEPAPPTPARATRRKRVSAAPTEPTESAQPSSEAGSEREVTPAPGRDASATPAPAAREPSATPTPGDRDATPTPETPRAQRTSLLPQSTPQLLRSSQPPRTPQQQRGGTPRAGQTPNTAAAAAAVVTPSATHTLHFQDSPVAAQLSPARSLRLGAPPGSRPQSSHSTQNPQATQNIEPIVLKNRGNTLLSQQPEDTGPKKRLVITHLMMNNFKSYAGERMVGPFHPSFTSVVGPNGSGKSNVIDSLLFVFGFRASKMRQGKLSALIHSSEAFPNLEFCEVQVFFQEVLDLPDGKYEVIEDSQIVVSRRALKNNTNKYYINGKTSDYTTVTSLLRGRGVDLDHKRFLILQGEVESIAQMKPKATNDSDEGLLEYLEDIIGTSKYKQPIEESITEVEELNDVCVEKSSRVKIVETERNSLEPKKEAALEFIRMENELAIEHAQLFQLYMQECDKNIRVTSEMITQFQAELDTEQENHRGSEDQIKKLDREYKAGVKEIEEIEKQTQAILHETSKTDKEKVKFQEKEKFLAQKEKKLQKSIQTSRLQASEATSLIERSLSDIEQFGVEAAEIRENLKGEEAELAKIRDALKEKTQGFSDEIAAKQKSLEPWNEKINKKRSEIAIAQSELEILYGRANEKKVELEEAQARIGTIEEARQTKEAELKECQKEKAALAKEALKVQAEIEKMARKEPQLKANLSAVRVKADEARSSMSSAQSQSKVLTGLMRLSESGRIDGFHGRLGNLGTIDPKYDIAVSTACPSLEHLVVDTVEIGQACIDYLRKNDLGRANFICLDKLPQRDMSKIQTPEGVPRLFDLLQPRNPGFAPAFYSVLQDTLVADDLQQANRVAFGAKRHRVVTLSGELFEKAGTMSGGGKTVSKGRMSNKLSSHMSKEAMQKLEQDRDVQENEYALFQEELRALQSKLREITERVPELDVTMSKIQLEISSSAKHMADAEQRIKNITQQKSTSSTDKSLIAGLEKKIKGFESEIEQLQEETAEVEGEIQVLQHKIMEVGGIQLRSQKAKVDGLREQLETLNEQISQAELAKSKSEKTKKKAEKIVTKGDEELEAIVLELEELKEDMKELEKSARESNEKATEAQGFLENKKDELAAMKEVYDEKMAGLNKTRAAEIEMKNKLEEHQKVLSDHQRRSSHWQEKLSKLRLHQTRDLTGGSDGTGDDEPETLPVLTEDELEDLDKDKMKIKIAVLEEKLKDVNIDLAVLSEYRRRVEEYTVRNVDLQAAINNRDGVKRRLDDLRKRRLEEFMEGFNMISIRLKEMYKMITMGGNAELELVDSLDPFSEGILFSVMPPKKSWKNISNLSGGEKTLSSLALVFALHHYKPTPLYVMDEIDAALDFRNVSIVASYIKERTKNAQFIVISLRNNMFELAARLVGVYKVNHMTKSVTIENKPYIQGSA
ncbi:nuclear condensin complex subunit Smc4 [Tricharina praecox]|uniref:nuclear condensin complex subunit Smc4 n=1 Tax=Tricharina praecox TaxID=43433 RepID=UPI0022207FCF|nr:nuclear condensin complex subunit Smc4 [Tricharina praecox]KAI5855413.1 nuclear condensin complex subunit Smc4 [Tricharina praecox]